MPIYDELIKQIKPDIRAKPVQQAQQRKNSTGEGAIEVLYKKVMLNSKYHHR